MDQYNDARTGLKEFEFRSVARGIIQQLGHKHEEAESIFHAICKVKDLLSSRIVRDVFNRKHHGISPGAA